MTLKPKLCASSDVSSVEPSSTTKTSTGVRWRRSASRHGTSLWTPLKEHTTTVSVWSSLICVSEGPCAIVGVVGTSRPDGGGRLARTSRLHQGNGDEYVTAT